MRKLVESGIKQTEKKNKDLSETESCKQNGMNREIKWHQKVTTIIWKIGY